MKMIVIFCMLVFFSFVSGLMLLSDISKDKNENVRKAFVWSSILAVILAIADAIIKLFV